MPVGRRSAARVVVITVCVVAIAAGLGLAAHIGWFLRNSSVHGAALVHRERQAIQTAGRDAQACQGSVGNAGRALAPRGTPEGLLEIPALGLVAPVLQGTGDEVLDDAVGHAPASVWPGHPGTTVLSAHDVTWFSRIDGLKAGDQIRYVTPCRTFDYQVTAHRVVHAGYPIYNTSTARIVLDTCYPLNALYLTNLRYVVYADLTQSLPTSPMPVPTAGPAPLAVPAPAALTAEGLSLQQNDAPLGTLILSGSPSSAWRQTNAPLLDEASALTAYFGILRSAEQDEQNWWADLAPSVPMSAAAAIRNGEITGYDTRLEITLQVRGSRVVGAKLAATVVVTGSSRPRTYDLAVTETVTGHDKLVVSGFALRNR